MYPLQRYLMPMLIVISALLFGTSVGFGFPLELAVLASSALTLALAWVFERRLPYRKDWRKSQGDTCTDLASAAVVVGVLDPLLKALAPVVVVAVYATVDAPRSFRELSLWLQIALVLIAVEFGKYWSHRLHHKVTSLWWLHAMHHSSERLYFINGLRIHPLNYLVNFSIAVLPVMFIGVSPEALLGYLALTQPIVLLQHANIDLRHGRLNWIISTPEAHRWHHSTKASEANCNFGNAILLWDHVFGTFKAAEGFDNAKKVGLFPSSRASYPGSSGYFAQLASMFKPSCCRA